MKKNKTYTVAFRRKRDGKTNYRNRLKLLLSNKLRLVIRKSLNNITVQIVEYDKKGDKVLESADSKELEKLEWKINKGNIPTAYLVGLLLGKKAKKQGLNNLVLDLGLNKSVKGSRIYAALKGVVDTGLNVSHNESVFPLSERINGNHISKYATELKKKNKEMYEKQFSIYIKNNVELESFAEIFEDTKNKILRE